MSKKLRRGVGLLLIVAAMQAGMPVKAQALDYKGHWAEAELMEWVERGILSGYADGTIRPNTSVTRAEFAKILVEIFGLEYSDETYLVYEDVKEGAWYSDYIACAVSANLMKVDEGQFRPNVPITREEAAYAVATAYHITQEGEMRFTDADAMSEWAQKEINALAMQGYLKGYEDGSFKPHNHLTRAEAIMMLDRLTAELINEAGTYTEDVEGNVVVNTTDVILKDMTIKGNLYLAEGIGEGDVTLDHVVVTGQTIVEGGGQHSVKLVGTSLDQIVVNKATGSVRLAADQSSTMGHVEVQSGVQLEGKIQKVEVGTAQEVKLVGAAIQEVQVVAQDAKVALDKNTVLQKIIADAKVEIAGAGTIKKAEINANGVKIEGVKLDKNNITVDKNVSQKPNLEIQTPSVGGSSSSGSSNDSSSDSEVVEPVEPVEPVQPVEKGVIQGCVKLEDALAVGAEVGLYKMVSEYESVGVARTVTDANGQATLSSSYTFPVGTQVSITVEKKGYETYTGTYTTTAEGMNEVSITLEKEEVIRPQV